jgi:hypothetical protein
VIIPYSDAGSCRLGQCSLSDVKKILIPTAVGRRAHDGFFGCEKSNVFSRVYLTPSECGTQSPGQVGQVFGISGKRRGTKAGRCPQKRVNSTSVEFSSSGECTRRQASWHRCTRSDARIETEVQTRTRPILPSSCTDLLRLACVLTSGVSTTRSGAGSPSKIVLVLTSDCWSHIRTRLVKTPYHALPFFRTKDCFQGICHP